MSQQQAVQPLNAEGGVDLGLPVRAVNHSDTDVVWTYDRARYVIPAGGERLVPYMAMVLWQGDPRAIDLPGGRRHEQFRRQQREHLRVLYGVYEHEERWAEIPQVDCYPLDSDVPFNTVLRDPEGVALVDQASGMGQARMMQETMDRMATQLRVLQSKIQQQEQIDGALAAADLDPDDLERQETTHRQVSPEAATGQSMVGPAPTRRSTATPAPNATQMKPKAAVTRDGE